MGGRCTANQQWPGKQAVASCQVSAEANAGGIGEALALRPLAAGTCHCTRSKYEYCDASTTPA
eukprot:scaffold358355_cov28-Prasinocladus_malaysianus.AAC.1